MLWGLGWVMEVPFVLFKVGLMVNQCDYILTLHKLYHRQFEVCGGSKFKLAPSRVLVVIYISCIDAMGASLDHGCAVCTV